MPKTPHSGRNNNNGFTQFSVEKLVNNFNFDEFIKNLFIRINYKDI